MGPGRGASGGLRNKGSTLFFRGQAAPSAVAQPRLLWSFLPPPCLDGTLLAALSRAFGLWSPRLALWPHLGAPLAQGNLLKTNPTKESKKE